MTTAIQQTPTIIFVQEILFKPFAEGAERVNRAIEGVNLHHIQHPEMDLLTRCWTLLVGIALMIPLINSVIWIFMNTFGNPEMLSEPFVSLPQAALQEMPLDIENPAPLQEESVNPSSIRGTPLSVRTMKFKDISNDKTLEGRWTFQTYDDMFYITREDGVDHSETSFDLNWVQKTHYIKKPDAEILVEKHGNTLFVNGFHNGKPVKKELELPNDLHPWIQQPTTGFRPFVLSEDKKLHFYGIHPEEFAISECVAEKEHEHLAPYGRVIKVSFKLKNAFLGFDLEIGHCWFKPENGDLLKMDYRLGLFAWGESTLIQE